MTSPATDSVPLVSIGMPVYNAERYLHQTIGSILAQTAVDFELIISDNASTDGSPAICAEFAARDPRIRFIRQQSNLGAGRNFRYVLLQARAPYFMWAGADDKRSPDFIAVTLDILQRRSDVVAAICPARFEGSEFDRVGMGDASVEDDEPARRVRAFFLALAWLGHWHANARYYSLIRREALMKCDTLSQDDFLAADWAIVLELLARGKSVRANTGELVLGRRGASSGNLFRQYGRGWLNDALPLGKFMRAVWRLSRPFATVDRFHLLWRVLSLNYEANYGRFNRWRRQRILDKATRST